MLQNRDETLLRRFAEGDHTAFSEIYDVHWEKLFLYAVRILGDENDAEDAVQDAFVSLWKYRHRAGQIQVLHHYLLAIVRNNTVKIIHRHIETRNYLDTLQSFFDELAHSADETFIAKGLEQFIDGEIEKLPAKMREIFVLSRKEQLSHKQIAEKLGISDETVKKQIYNSLKTLRFKLNQDQYSALFAFLLMRLFF